MRIRFMIRRLMAAVALVALSLAATHFVWDQEEVRVVFTMSTGNSPIQYDDPGTWPEVRRAVRVATDAVRLPPDTLRYSVTGGSDGWVVVVRRVKDDGPGGSTTVVLDRDYKVTRITPGE